MPFNKKNLDEIIDISNNEIRIPFEKIHDAISESIPLVEYKCQLEKDFEL